MHRFARPVLMDISRYKPGKPIEEVQRELGLEKILKLGSNETLMLPPEGVLEALRKAITKVNLYPDDSIYHLTKALAEKLGVEENMITWGSGTVELIREFALAFIDPGDEAVVATPSFGIYPEEFKLHGARVVKVPLDEGFEYDLDTMLDSVSDRTKVVVICSPNNPTGTIVTREALENFLKNLGAKTLVILDEAYFEFVDHPEYHNGVELLRKYDNLIVFRTMSKAYALAGLRIGYGIASPSIIAAFEKVRLPFNLSRIAQAAALAALREDGFVENLRNLISREKDYVYKRLDEMGLSYIKSYTNFIPIKVGDDKKISEHLLSKGIIVRPGYQFSLPGYIRVTVSPHREDNEWLLRGLEEVKELVRV